MSDEKLKKALKHTAELPDAWFGTEQEGDYRKLQTQLTEAVEVIRWYANPAPEWVDIAQPYKRARDFLKKYESGNSHK